MAHSDATSTSVRVADHSLGGSGSVSRNSCPLDGLDDAACPLDGLDDAAQIRGRLREGFEELAA